MLRSIILLLSILNVMRAESSEDEFPYPLHASCKLTWIFPMNCETVAYSLQWQINEYSQDECPGVSEECPELPCGQRCKYRFIEYDEEHNLLLAEHRTPVQDFVDNLSFRFTRNDIVRCVVEARSYSDTFFALYDGSTNYCNLRRLVDGWVDADRFVEITNNTICTQYDVNNCQRF